MRTLIKLSHGSAFICLLLLSFCQRGRAQQKGKLSQEDTLDLEKQVATLGRQQQQIIDELNELKQLLAANAVGRPQMPPPPSTLATRGEPFTGDSAARVAIVEYADFECPFCGMYARQVYPQIVENYIKTGKVKFFYRDLPFPNHPHAVSAARADRCAGEQGKYWEIHDDLFANQTALGLNDIFERAKTFGIDVEKLSECLASEKYTDDIRKSMSEAQQLGIQGTPTFFLGTIGSNGDVVSVEKRILGAAPYEVFKTDLDALLASKGQDTVPAQ